MLAEWMIAGSAGHSDEKNGEMRISNLPPRLGEDYDIDVLEGLEAAVMTAPSLLAGVKEARAWQEMIAPNQGIRGGSDELPNKTRVRHLLGLISCCPTRELESLFPSLARELLAFLRRRAGDGDGGVTDVETRSLALAALDELLRRMLENAATSGAYEGGNGAVVIAKKSGGARQAVVSLLPKLLPAVTACLEGSPTSDDGSSIVPPPAAVAMGALGVLEALAFLLRSTMRPHVKRLQDATVLWLQGPDDAIRDRAAAVLASLPLCSEGDAWTLAAGKVTLEAHGLLQTAWPDDDVDMGSDFGASQLNDALSAGGGLLPRLNAGNDGFAGPQQAFTALVVRRFKGLCRVLELMLSGDSYGRAVTVPVPLILALVERVQRMAPTASRKGPQAFVPVAQGALSHGALGVIYPALSITASRLLDALAFTPLPTIRRNGRRFSRALIQGILQPSATGSLRAARYRSVARAMLQLGAGAALDLAMPALPALLEEVRVVIGTSESQTVAGNKEAIVPDAASTTVYTGATSRDMTASGSAAPARGMRVEPVMSARKSSHKKQRKLRDKEMGRALAAADAAAAAAEASGSTSSVVPGSREGGGGAMTGAAALGEREAVCAALVCMARLVGCCKGHLPLAGRLAVEDVLHRGLRILAHSGGKDYYERTPSGGGLLEPAVAREFLGLAQECLVTPMADGTRSGSLSMALAAFRSLGSYPDEELAAASQRALAACSSILYPTAAPLHLSHAVTSQARAWGSNSASSYEQPLGWGKRLAEAGVGDMEDDVESEDDIDGAGSKGRMSLTLGFATREITTVVTRSAETQSDLQIFDGGTSSSTPRAVPLESITDDKNNHDVLPKSKGKGKSREREASAAPGTDDTVTAVVPSSGTSLTVERRGREGEAEAAVKSGEAEEEEGSPRPKRLKVGVGRLAAAMADVDPSKNEEGNGSDVGLHEAHSGDACGDVGGQSFSKQEPEEEAVRGHGVDGSGDEEGGYDGDRAEDDDNFDFPSIIDADPDSD